jgi:hypothetical protein
MRRDDLTADSGEIFSAVARSRFGDLPPSGGED